MSEYNSIKIVFVPILEKWVCVISHLYIKIEMLDFNKINSCPSNAWLIFPLLSNLRIKKQDFLSLLTTCMTTVLYTIRTRVHHITFAGKARKATSTRRMKELQNFVTILGTCSCTCSLQAAAARTFGFWWWTTGKTTFCHFLMKEATAGAAKPWKTDKKEPN